MWMVYNIILVSELYLLFLHCRRDRLEGLAEVLKDGNLPLIPF